MRVVDSATRKEKRNSGDLLFTKVSRGASCFTLALNQYKFKIFFLQAKQTTFCSARVCLITDSH